MADLIFADSHNMVAFLEKSEDNADFADIVDFLNASPIRYALTVSPTVYVSYIKQFWSIVKIKTVNNETQIRAKVDGKTIVITKSSVRRDLHFNDEDGITCLTNTEIFENLQLMGFGKLLLRHLKLEDSNGISNLPTTKFFEQLALMGSKKTAWEQFSSNIATAIICLATNRTFNFSKLIFDVISSEGSTHPVESYHTPTSAPPTSQPPVSLTSRRLTRQESMVLQPGSPTQTNVADDVASIGVDVRLGGATTTVTSLEAGQGSGNIDKTPTMPHDSPLLRVYTLRSDVGRMQQNELMDLVTKLSDRVVQGRHEHDMEPNFEFTALEEVYTTEKGVSTAEPVSTAGASVSTTSFSPKTRLKLMKKKGRGLLGYKKKQALSILKNGRTFKLELKLMKNLLRD
ncbi:hypothetical protein Tco_0700262 [Tanacetum coccineum]